ncbi:unnamed protein product [Closterium sp. NIES-53]
MFDESVSYYHLFPYRSASLPPPPLFLAPDAPLVDPLPPQGPAHSDVSQVDAVEPVEVAVDSSAARGAEPTGAGPGGVEPGVAESEGTELGGAEPERVEPRGAEPGGAESGGAERGGGEPERAESGGPPGVPSRREPLSPQQLREWYTRLCRRAAGGAAGAAPAGGASGAAGGTAGVGAARAVGPGGAGGGGSAGAGGASGVGAAGGTAGAVAARAAGAGGTGAVGGPTGVGAVGGAGAAGPRGARTGGPGAAGAGGAAGVGAVGAGAVDTGGVTRAGAGGAAGVVAGDPGAEGTGAVSAVSGGTARPRPSYTPLLQQLASPLPGPSPYSGPTRGLTERRERESHPASLESRPASPESLPESLVCTGCWVPRQRPPPVPGTHSMTHRPSSAAQRVPLPSPPAPSLPALADPDSDSIHTASPTVTRLMATVVTDRSFESAAASALVAELVDFAAHCRLDYTASLVAESASVYPPSVGGECALGTDGDPDAPDIPTPRSYAEAIEVSYSSQWQAAMDAEMASWKSTGTYVDEVPAPGANIVSGMWIFRMTTLRVLLHVTAQRDYELHSLDFSTAFLQGSLNEEIWLRHPPGFTGSFLLDARHFECMSS